MRLSPATTAMRVTLPSAGPYIVTGIKLAVAYAFIGVIGSEFILSRGGIGYEISFAYTNFDNATMYPLIVLILLASVAINAGLSRWEHRLLSRRGMLAVGVHLQANQRTAHATGWNLPALQFA